MTSLENGADIPASSRLSQVGDQILAEQARHALSSDSFTAPLKLDLPKSTDFGGTQNSGAYTKDWDNADSFPGAGKIRVGPAPPSNDEPRLSDKLADKIYPGFGRIESEDPNSKWRFDFIDTGRCKTKARLRMCFTMNFR
jgi:hypothetical protein